jgi:hypothetical protein
MLKCVLRFTAILKPCNPQTIPLMSSRQYDLRRRGGLEHAELDDKVEGSDRKETEEEKPTFKGLLT